MMAGRRDPIGSSDHEVYHDALSLWTRANGNARPVGPAGCVAAPGRAGRRRVRGGGRRGPSLLTGPIQRSKD
jgi:hypothetical protein